MKLIFSFKKQLTFCIALSIFGLMSAQTKQIQGTVLDEYEVPLMGASVIIQGTVQGTITDFNGLFSIERRPHPSRDEEYGSANFV
jgi:hypothetical protein